MGRPEPSEIGEAIDEALGIQLMDDKEYQRLLDEVEEALQIMTDLFEGESDQSVGRYNLFDLDEDFARESIISSIIRSLYPISEEEERLMLVTSLPGDLDDDADEYEIDFVRRLLLAISEEDPSEAAVRA